MSTQTVQNSPAEREFVVEHTFNVPVEDVFNAYTDSHMLSLWWAPKGGSLTVETMDVRPGGMYRFVQRDAKGHTMVYAGKYLDVQPNTRLMYTFSVEGQNNNSTTTVDLKESNGKTNLKFTNRYSSKEERDTMLQNGAAAGAKAAFNRLDEILSG